MTAGTEVRTIAIAAGLALIAAATPATAAPTKAKPNDDPNREICKSRPVVGSRLKRIRECHSAAEWEEMKLAERIGLARQQTNGAPGCNGDPYVQACSDVGMKNGGRDTPW